MQPLSYLISSHRWQLFVTLTFNSRDERGRPVKVPGVGARRKMLFAFLRETAKGLKRDRTGRRTDSIPFHALSWVAREETGELNGRYHFHLLLSGLPPGRLNTTERFVIKSIWTGVGGGHSDVRVFDTQLAGVNYVLKGLEQWSRAQANAYEVGKFREVPGVDRELIVSNACLEKWRQGFAERTRATTAGTRSAVNTGVSPVGPGNGTAKRAKETPEEVARRRYERFGSHPAGVSFVR